MLLKSNHLQMIIRNIGKIKEMQNLYGIKPFYKQISILIPKMQYIQGNISCQNTQRILELSPLNSNHILLNFIPILSTQLMENNSTLKCKYLANQKHNLVEVVQLQYLVSYLMLIIMIKTFLKDKLN